MQSTNQSIKQSIIVFSTVYADMSLSYCTTLPINQSINQSFQPNPIQCSQPTNQLSNQYVSQKINRQMRTISEKQALYKKVRKQSK